MLSCGEIDLRRSRIFAASANSYPGMAGVSTKSRKSFCMELEIVSELDCANARGAMQAKITTKTKKQKRFVMAADFPFESIGIGCEF